MTRVFCVYFIRSVIWARRGGLRGVGRVLKVESANQRGEEAGSERRQRGGRGGERIEDVNHRVCDERLGFCEQLLKLLVERGRALTAGLQDVGAAERVRIRPLACMCA